MSNRKALGRGLAALIPQAPSEEPVSGVQEIPIVRILPNPNQPRQRFCDEQLQELVASLREHGIIEPVVVRPKEDCYELVVGERRWRAAREAGLETVPAVVRQMSDRQALEIALVENVQREDLNAIEEAEAFHRLSIEFDLTQEEIATRVGKQRSTVANRMRLMELAKPVQEFVRTGNLSAGHAKALLAVPDKETQLRLAMRCLKEHLSVRQVEELVRKISSPAKVKKKEVQSGGQFTYLEEQFQDVLGTKVRITKKGNKGQIQIEFYGDEDISRIFDLIVGIDEGAG